MTNRIGWCSMTFNPVIGCKNNCIYCYARRINNRFKFIENWNKPEWKENNFRKKFPKKPQRIFVGSMSEIYYWELLWMNKVINKIKQYPQHIFQFLTKFPDAYIDWNFPDNCWLGVTITNNESMHSIEALIGKKFISIEPILEDIDIKNLDFIPIKLSWVIVGAETGNRKDKIIPKIEWIHKIVNYCRDRDIPVYLKDSLKDIYPVEIKEFPK